MAASLDGSGEDYADFSTYRTTRSGVDIVARDGLSRATLWAIHRALPQPMQLFKYHAADLTGDGRAEVLAVDCANCNDAGGVRHVDIVVVDGATGTVRWAVA